MLHSGTLRLLPLLALPLVFACKSPDPTQLPPPVKLDPTGETVEGDPEVIFEGDYELSQEAQAYLWEMERRYLAIKQDFVKPLHAALISGDVAPIEPFLARYFRGFVLPGASETGARPGIKWELRRDMASARTELKRKEYFRYWEDELRDFELIDRIHTHITQLTPDKRAVDPNARWSLEGPWTARWDMHVEGVTHDGGRMQRVYKHTLHFKELTVDPGRQKRWVEFIQEDSVDITRSDRVLMLDVTDRTAIDVAAFGDNWNRPGPPYKETPGSTSLLDANLDGYLDMLIGGDSGTFLYINQRNGSFRDMTEAMGLERGLTGYETIKSSVIADLDGDGDEDIILVDVPWGAKTMSLQPDRSRWRIYSNEEGKTFRRLEDDQHTLPLTAYMGVAVADFNNDGLVDLYVPNGGKQPPAKAIRERWIGKQVAPHGVLLINNGDWVFSDVTDYANASGGYRWVLGTMAFDADLDGDTDLFLANHDGDNGYLINDGHGRFTDGDLQEIFGGFCMGATFGDYDADGDQDLYMANMYSSAGSRIIGSLSPEDYPPGVFPYIRGWVTGNEIYRTDLGGRLVATGTSLGASNAGWAYGPTTSDFDGDGFSDIYSPAGFQSIDPDEPDG